MSVTLYSAPNVAYKTSARERYAHLPLNVPTDDNYGVFRPAPSRNVSYLLTSADDNLAHAVSGDLLHRSYHNIDTFDSEQAHALGLILA